MSKYLLLVLFNTVLHCSTGFAQSEIQFMTFNIRYDNPNDPLTWEERKNEVAKAMMFQDVVGVQEALDHQVAYLDSQLRFHAHYGVGRDDGMKGGEFCPVFYNTQKFDFIHGETIWLSLSPNVPGSIGWDADLPRIASIVLLQHKESGKTIRVVNTHFSHVGITARENAAQLIRGYVSNHSQDHIVVMGDFNEESDDPAFKLLNTAPLNDSYEGNPNRCRDHFTTYSTFNPSGVYEKRIDHIFTDFQVEWICIEEIIKYGYFISDHHPLFIVVNL